MGFGSALLLLLFVSASSYRSINQLIADSDDEGDSSELVDAMRGLQTATADAELAARDYVMTGSDTYVDAYNRSAASVPRAVSDVRDKKSGDTVFTQQVAALDA